MFACDPLFILSCFPHWLHLNGMRVVRECHCECVIVCLFMSECALAFLFFFLWLSNSQLCLRVICRFELVRSHAFDYNRFRSPHTHMNRDNVGLIVELKLRSHNAHVCVVNTHLFWGTCVWELEAVCDYYSSSGNRRSACVCIWQLLGVYINVLTWFICVRLFIFMLINCAFARAYVHTFSCECASIHLKIFEYECMLTFCLL